MMFKCYFQHFMCANMEKLCENIKYGHKQAKMGAMLDGLPPQTDMGLQPVHAVRKLTKTNILLSEMGDLGVALRSLG
jgi:hypothetical protein